MGVGLTEAGAAEREAEGVAPADKLAVAVFVGVPDSVPVTVPVPVDLAVSEVVAVQVEVRVPVAVLVKLDVIVCVELCVGVQDGDSLLLPVIDAVTVALKVAVNVLLKDAVPLGVPEWLGLPVVVKVLERLPVEEVVPDSVTVMVGDTLDVSVAVTL